MNDLDLRRAILDELEFQPHINAAAIGVAIENGVVILSGHVRTYAEKEAAERAAKSVKGVNAVVEKIEVRVPRELETRDEVIASRCLDVIRWSTTTASDRIQIDVQQGWVTLNGEVDWQFQKEAVQDAVRKLTGVVGVNNKLVVKPKDSVDDVRSQIEAALGRSAEVDASKVRITVSGSSVKLDGHVHHWRERKACERAAWAAPGVSHVDNGILIV